MFESLDKINIGKISLELPKKKEPIFFDPEKEMTDEKWKKVKDSLSAYKENFDPYTLFRSLFAAKLAFPQRFSELTLSEDDWQLARKTIQADVAGYDQFYPFPPAEMGACAKILWPEHINEINQLLQSATATNQRHGKNILDPWNSIYQKITCPQKAWEELGPAWLEEDIQSSYQNKNWYNLAHFLATSKIFFPEKKLNTGMVDELYRSLPGMFKRYLGDTYIKNNGIHNFLLLAFHLKILAAQEIKITDTSFKIIMPETEPDIKEKIPPMPVFKKYK